MAVSANSAERADALMELGQVARRDEKWAVARDNFGAAAELFAELGSDYEFAKASYSIGYCQARLQQHDAAVPNLMIALERARELNDSQDIAYSAGPLGDCLEALGRYKESIEVYELAVSAYEDLGEKGPAGYGSLSLGDICLRLAEQAKAKAHFERAIAFFQEDADAFSAAFARERLAFALMEVGSGEQAVGVLSQALSVYEFLEAEERIADTHLRLGIAHLRTSRFIPAKKHLQVAIANFRKHNDFHRAALAEVQLVFAKLFGDPEERHGDDYTSLSRAIAYLEAAGDKAAVAEARSIEARYSMVKSRFEEAVHLWKRVLVEARESESLALVQTATTNLARCYLEIGAHANGRTLLKQVDPSHWGDNKAEKENYFGALALADSKPTEDAEEPAFRCGNAVQSWVEMMQLP